MAQTTKNLVPLHRAEWFRRLDALGGATAGESGLKCASLCTGRCCPHAAMATREPAYTVSHVAIMLPFEMEYIVARTGVHPARFRRTPAKIAPGVVVEIGSFDIEMPCPFLTDDFQCWGYAFRPMDCRSFPLVPVFGDGGELTFRLGTGCPSLDTFSPAYQARLKAAWRNLLPHLSADYRAVYNRL
ncbi:MAG: YkgJ family cysteine cluster protein [Chloroflexi bacterium]|nr:YkgJ family cysteine cluster protein [Chloroflexota bacterium]